MQVTVSIIITGKVQGVFFRQSTREKALALNITGKVCNRPDGSVFIIATGTRENINALAEWCRLGPARAAVSSVTVEELPLQYFEDFRIER